MALPDRKAAARQLGVSLEDGQWDALERYVALLQRWNTRFNLISRRDTQRIWSRHVLDSLSILPILAALPCRGGRCRALDVGTGAGFPGLPLAVADAGTDWLLVDRNSRKVRFLELVAQELNLGNVAVRTLDLGVTPPNGLEGWADVIVSRAMEAPFPLVERTGGMLAAGGTFLLMTGARAAPQAASVTAPVGAAATAAVPVGYRLGGVCAVAVPGLDQVHEVTIIHRDAGGRAEQHVEQGH